jgi:predicted DsbA family dithiol-disulfide isomerase
MAEIPKVSVDIWSDVMCPWCAIGYGKFAKALTELEGEIEVITRWMPFELNPDLPPEGKSQDLHLAEVYGRSPEEVAEMRARMEEAGRDAGFSMAYEGEGDPPPAMMWNTFEAHKLLRWTLASGGSEAQTRLKLALFKAHFQYRRNVGERDVLLDIAEEEGFDRAVAAEALEDEALGIAVRLEEQRAREQGINSVPSFIFNGRYIVPGAQEPEVFAATLRRVAELAETA